MSKNTLGRWMAAAVLVMATGAVWGEGPDYTIEPGKRVSAVTRTTTLSELQTAYGPKNVKATDLPGVEGETIKGAIVLGGTDREMHVIWDPENPEKEALEVELVGKAWDLEGLKRGATLAEVEKANGAPFKMTGFGWDMGGYALFEKGKLAGKVMVRFTSTGPQSDDIQGDRQIPSTHAGLRAAKPVVEKVSIFLK
ncbi:hypothetical protein [Roseimicrobium sp. ORNL1]|uniref:hypothetical protein n=1 Tax=Roseimicrobium sp. ORNL1 TaxID=2711231 RepID=UPI0013E18400|nr:hypothetical protein [Roseimicrobium sp. ORNL1]QIF01332.1 hypothetical protein G5S37_07295 [Roseimicrobium sp. ORNL1]